VRSPLVFGTPVKGNLATLLRWADSPWPLPFAAIRNRRSFVHVDDLASLLLECAHQPRAAGELYLAAHPEPFSTPGLIAQLRDALGRKRRLYAAPSAALELAASIAGLSEAVRSLTRSLEVDASRAAQHLGWRARHGLAHAVGEMVRWHRAPK
jgi:UDP-glucose 4-epimerase